MKTRHVLPIYLLLALMTSALAQPPGGGAHEPPRQGLNGKTMESCKSDLQKFCNAVNLKAECLVAHWTKIASDCQDALARPIRQSGDGG